MLKYYTCECTAYDGTQGCAHIFGRSQENAEAIVREHGMEPIGEPVERTIVQEHRLTSVGKQLLELVSVSDRKVYSQ